MLTAIIISWEDSSHKLSQLVLCFELLLLLLESLLCYKNFRVWEWNDIFSQFILFLFLAGFSHYSEPNKINLNALRLCFQVFIPDSNGKLCVPLPPVISTPIFDNSKYITSRVFVCDYVDLKHVKLCNSWMYYYFCITCETY